MQTRQPDHPLLTTLIQHGYQRFAISALAERNAAGLPPFSYQALVNAQARDVELPATFLQAVINLAAQTPKHNVLLLGPVAAPMAKRAGFHRYQLLLQSNQRSDLQTLLTTLIPAVAKLKIAAKVRWSLDVDPVDLY